ncbi:membrane protein insertase YidC [Candidatus Dependentiae bacterium]|nr:membrane protein insertase YidC [Candidatus Dependentiae bacterium]
MNIKFKDLLLPLGFALVITWGFQYFFINHAGNNISKETGVVSGQTFVAPQTKQTLKPLNTEVDFFDEQRAVPVQETIVETEFARYIFSTDGGCLQSVLFKRAINGQQETITTVAAPPENEREVRCFLLALGEKTPYYYNLANKKDNDETVKLAYKAETDQALVIKTFTIHKKTHKIDVEIGVQPKVNKSLEARLFFSAPRMLELGEYDVVSAVMNDAQGSITRTARNSIDLNQGRYTPSFFGADNRYFIHVLIDDIQGFASRAYYKLTGKDDLFAILESSEITKQTSWKLSFYFGPKEENAMVAVDQRLEQTLGYSGWFAFISKFLLKVLKFFYSYLRNYGLAIILLTIIMRLVMFPFTINTYEQRKKGSEYKKKLAYLQQKYKSDPERLAQERAALIKKHGLPGIGGCLPMLLQLPVFIALSRLLNSSFELYHAPFFWVKDLSAKDPYYILPFLVFFAMLIQAVTMPGNKESRLPMLGMAFVFGAIAANFSAGLALYIFISTSLSVFQAIVTTKMNRA